MQKIVLVVLCACGFLAVEPAAESSPNYSQQIALALKTARHADITARAALSASKVIPSPLKGNDGAAGQNGAQGLSGTPGPEGSTGAAGSNGNNGTNGTSGLEGPSGAQGIQGPKGDTGSAGTSIKAYGHVTASGTGTTTQGTTVTHPGLGSYCLTDTGFYLVAN